MICDVIFPNFVVMKKVYHPNAMDLKFTSIKKKKVIGELIFSWNQEITNAQWPVDLVHMILKVKHITSTKEMYSLQLHFYINSYRSMRRNKHNNYHFVSIPEKGVGWIACQSQIGLNISMKLPIWLQSYIKLHYFSNINSLQPNSHNVQ